ncbi:patatin-like phospholipase family protein [Winogradskyella undariae]|uniref:patatin-like phospholipase family protein n=1 Tax=Winogradskyella undariae TaxID=1285465 RepID=UPI0020C449AF|nr:patatin-like phospholipase family protein [Winogradskyella undariae]
MLKPLKVIVFLKPFLLILLMIGVSPIFAQNKKPKVALVLSGGGAKGVAHIPTLQALDSLGIVPDLIVGNSMGSIVGGLYAMGYSGDSIASIALNAKWDELIGGGVSLKDVSVEEKSEYNKYLISLDWKKGKINPGAYLLNDQNIREFISSLTYPSYNINNFDDLSIPFRAIATDIVNGKEIIFNKGSLAFAMRASMSIPGAFSAVPYHNTLLVDGGLLNNFPVDVAKAWGADIIIGSDVGSGMVTKEKLNNISALLFQAGMMGSNLKTPENRKLCDILIDHSNNLTYTTGDFSKINPIYEEGKLAVKENIAALSALSERLKGFKQRTHELPEIKDEFVLNNITYGGISKENLALVKARMNIKTNKKYTRKEVVSGVNRAMGTTIFSQVTFLPIIKGDSLRLKINGLEKSKHQVKGSLHYDDTNGVGLILNYTGRNIIGNASRSLVTIDIAEQPKFRLQHQKNFSHDRDWWWRSEAFGQQLKQKVFIGGENVDNLKYRYFEFDNQVNRNINSLKNYIGMGVKYQNITLKPTIDPEFNENIFSLEKYNFNDFEVYFHYVYNTLNAVYYASDGSFFKAALNRSLSNNININFSDENISDINGSTNNFTKINLDFERRFQLTPKTVGIVGFNTAFIIEDAVSANDITLSEFGIGANYFLGGNISNPRNDSYIFPGLNESELNASQFMRVNLGLQLNTMHKFYVTPHIDIASVGFGNFEDYAKEAFLSKGNWSDSNEASILVSAGTTFSYNSILGPVDFDVSWVNNTNKVRFFIGIGLHFNRTN